MSVTKDAVAGSEDRLDRLEAMADNLRHRSRRSTASSRHVGSTGLGRQLPKLASDEAMAPGFGRGSVV